MRLSIMQLFWNNAADIPVTAVATLREAQRLREVGHSVQLIFVDNGSRDATPAMLWELLGTWGHAALIRNEENLGLSVARNQSLGAATGDYILVLDGDVAPFRGTERLADYLREHPECVCLGFSPFNCEDDPLLAGRPLPPKLRVSAITRTSDGGTGLWHCVLNAYGIFPAWPFRHAGVRFSEEAVFTGPGWGHEDNDLFRQLARLGEKEVHCITNARFHHRVHSSYPLLEAQNVLHDSVRKRQVFYELKWKNRLPKVTLADHL